ncbi:hypothetical protein [Flavobacterium soyangense]|uniref:FHA domain-containing protein n=1 Tax=Flavobacterium soyangense TaxID=2023265 RepID=A0A930UC02_9FLAO|nr:hypothetical protein [Flavobacterium soyangense]MBF2709280.1 hypothetical protein [Flavobacterium soyangense]
MTWEEILLSIKNLPYGRNSNRTDFSLVVAEKKGTCSSKHAYLKDFADKNSILNVKLVIGIYKMNESNTKIGTILSENKMEYIPEAHCYLKIDGVRFDCTSSNSDFDKIKNDLLEEIEIEPYQVGDFKIEYHQNFIKNWLSENNSGISFEQIWKIREQCIENLSL